MHSFSVPTSQMHSLSLGYLLGRLHAISGRSAGLHFGCRRCSLEYHSFDWDPRRKYPILPTPPISRSLYSLFTTLGFARGTFVVGSGMLYCSLRGGVFKCGVALPRRHPTSGRIRLPCLTRYPLDLSAPEHVVYGLRDHSPSLREP